jgi:hypothetical protein
MVGAQVYPSVMRVASIRMPGPISSRGSSHTMVCHPLFPPPSCTWKKLAETQREKSPPGYASSETRPPTVSTR